jgi:hypothetical protein
MRFGACQCGGRPHNLIPALRCNPELMLNAGSNMAARMAMMAITRSNSISMKAGTRDCPCLQGSFMAALSLLEPEESALVRQNGF